MTDTPRAKPKLALLDGAGPSPSACLDAMHAHKSALLSLCDRLERVADALPVPIDTRECLSLAETLMPTVLAAHRFEEDRFFMAARIITGGSRMVSDAIDRLCDEHHEDECFAEEVGEALVALASGTSSRDAETIGYMLRGFFGQMRRHVAFENDFLCRHVAEQLEL